MYNDHRIVSDRTIDSHIKKLRKKLADEWSDIEFIHSVYGAGYRFELEQAPSPT
jgi:two-component system response regulator BaeR